ncbi:MAG: peptidoglycan-binding domain-containing protein [Pseudomonadota bacterium]
MAGIKAKRWLWVAFGIAAAVSLMLPASAPSAADAEIAPAGSEDTAPVSYNLVKAAQRFLASNNYEPGPADGIAGPMTEAAVMAWQRDHDLETNGMLDAPTLASMGLGSQ